jgi:hypothetical protein
MSNGQPSNDDRDLLSRLNALKKTTIAFDDTEYARLRPRARRMP